MLATWISDLGCFCLSPVFNFMITSGTYFCGLLSLLCEQILIHLATLLLCSRYMNCHTTQLSTGGEKSCMTTQRVAWRPKHSCKEDYTFTGSNKSKETILACKNKKQSLFSRNKIYFTFITAFLWLLWLRRLLFWWHGTNDVRVTRISYTEDWHTEVLATSCSQFNVVASVMMDSSLSQHGIVLNLTLPVNRHKAN